MTDFIVEHDPDIPQSCGNCWFWKLGPLRRRATAVVHVEAPACHRLPPMPHIGADVGYKWPRTDKHDWCGEWSPCWAADEASSESDD